MIKYERIFYMKKSPLVNSIVSAIFAIAAAALLIFMPTFGTELSGYVSSNFRVDAINNLWPALKATVSFSIGRPVISGIVVGLLGVVAIFWLWHFIVLIATRRPNSLSINIFWLIFGLVSTWVLFAFVGYIDASTGYIFNGTVANAGEIHNGVSLLRKLFTDNFAKHAASIFLLLGIGLLAVLGYIFGLISVIGALADDIKNPNEKIDEEEFTSIDEEGNPTDKKSKKKKKNKETDPKVKQTEGEAEKKEGQSPLIVQHINYGGQPQAVYPQPYYWGQPPYYAPAPAPEKKEEKPALTEADVRKIIDESLANQQAAIISALGKKEEVVEPKPVVEEKLDERPLTAKELRTIIKNELKDHDHPEELMPLTDEQCRSLIREELDNYYASTRPQDEKVEETSVASVPEEPKEDTVEEELMTADELSKMIRNEVIQVLDENKEGKEEITLDSIKTTIKEEIAKSKEGEADPVTIDEISSVISDELAPLKETEQTQNKNIDTLNEQYAKIDSLTEQVSKIDGLTEQVSKIDALSEQVAKKAEDDKVKDEETKTAIENLKASQLSAEDIRNIIAEELAKRPVVVQEVVAPTPVEEPAEEPVAEPVPETPAEPVADEAATDEKAAERVPFAERVMNLDDDVKEAYNELKAEALSYGLKSRLSLSGDTFRLHTKTYLKIAVAGKGLKLYLALDPHDYKDSPIPVKDVGTKNVYKDIPLAFKVKSPLSLKRAKQLIKDACEKDNLSKEEISPLNYVSQLASYRVAGSDEEIEEDEE